MTTAINKTLAILLLLAAFACATEVPKSIGESVRFSRMGEAKGLLSEQRFVEALYLAMNALGVGDKPAPRILVVHVDDYFGKFAGIGEQKMSLWTPPTCAPRGDKECRAADFYELWVEDEFDNSRMASAATSIVAHNFEKDQQQQKSASHQVLTELNATVDVRAKR